jgi:lipoprotein-releasing system ATP-binding protein
MATAHLSVEGVSKGYSRGGRWTEVLRDVSLEVGRKEVVAVVGSRLDGKTTLLKVAAGMEPPQEGSVSLSGRPLTAVRDRERGAVLGRQIRWIDRQGPALGVEASRFVGWPLTLHGAKRKQTEQEAARMLERTGAQDCVGRRWGQLSNWQRVLVGLARAFVGTPQVVVIDDLLDSLGVRGTEEASHLLRSLVEESHLGCGVLVSASDMESAMFADRVWSITGKGSLKLMAGQPSGEGQIVQFPDRSGLGVGGPPTVA